VNCGEKTRALPIGAGAILTYVLGRTGLLNLTEERQVSVFLIPNRGIAASKYVKLELAANMQLVQHTADKYCLSLVSTSLGSVLKDKDGEPLSDGILKVGQKASLDMGKLSADKYHLMLIPNPELARSAYVGGPILLEPYTTEELQFLLRVERQINLSELGYLFRIYIMD